MMLRWQFNLRALFVAVSIFAVLLAVAAAIGIEMVLGFKGLLLSCGFVLLVTFALTPIDKLRTRLPPLTALICTPLLYCLVSLAFFMFGEAIDQPHPLYERGNWITVSWSQFSPAIPF